MKRIIIAFIAALSIAIVGAASPPAAEAQAYCNHCCDFDSNNNARIRCTLVAPGLCNANCECLGIGGSGFACY